MKYQATITVLWGVTWSMNEIGSTNEPVWFENKEDADKVSKAPMGWYNQTGSVRELTCIDGKGLPRSGTVFTSVKEWSAEYLTPNTAKKYGFA